MRQQTAQTRQELARTETEIKKQASAWGKEVPLPEPSPRSQRPGRL